MMRSFEVEGIEKFFYNLDNVVVGCVVKIEKHPNADKLRVAMVEIGKKNIIQVVCGAPNVAEGQKVAVALSGAKLQGNIEIKVAEIRGVESRGMICSEKELGLGNGHNGILVLPKDALVGMSFAEYVGLEDNIFEIKVLPDRGSDALAYRGMAREIAALGGHKPRFSEKYETLKISRNNRAPKIVISDKACRRYIGISFENVKVGESPLWMKTKLILSGLHLVNNIVDITNYLMLLYGQPMHVFDSDKITGIITIRRAKKNEKLKILTGETKTLFAEDLVIADEKQVLALAGVMGGAYAAITEQTKNIFLEIANFDGANVRRSKARHNLPTDASYRFERNLDPNIAGEVAREVCSLITEFASGKFIGMRDVYPLKVKEWKITLSLARIGNVLGAEISQSEAARYLELLGLAVKKNAKGKSLEVTVPTRRPDLRDEWDLIEEIGRLYGYNKIIPQAPILPLKPVLENPKKIFEREVKKYLAASGFDEIMTYSFYGEREIAATALPVNHHLELENPLSPDLRYLRMTTVSMALRKVKENLRHFDKFDIFEWGNVFGKNPKTGAIGEVKTLLLISVYPKKSQQGNLAPTGGFIHRSFSGGGQEFFYMKGKAEAFLLAMHIGADAVTFELPEKFPEIPVMKHLHPARSACICHNGKVIGIIGEFHPKTLKAFGLESRIAMAGFIVDELQALQKKEIIFQPLPKFPFATRDISLTFPNRVTVAEVETLFREAGETILKKWELFDVYEKEGKKSLAFHLYFGAPDRTLSSEEMDKTFDRIVALAQERFGATLRL